MGYIFISYSRQDQDWALHLAGDLVEAGCQVWLDQWNITGRQPFWNEIQEAIEKSSFFLFIISPASIAPDSGVFRELCHATTVKSLTLVPVMVRAVEYRQLPIQTSPGMYHIHNFTQAPYEQALPRLLATLKGTPPAAIPAASGSASNPCPETSLDTAELADLVVRSGRADDIAARTALCIEIGLIPSELNFLDGAARSFALRLVQFCLDTGNWRALDRLCKAIQKPLKDGGYAARLKTLHDIIKRQLGR